MGTLQNFKKEPIVKNAIALNMNQVFPGWSNEALYIAKCQYV